MCCVLPGGWGAALSMILHIHLHSAVCAVYQVYNTVALSRALCKAVEVYSRIQGYSRIQYTGIQRTTVYSGLHPPSASDRLHYQPWGRRSRLSTRFPSSSHESLRSF